MEWGDGGREGICACCNSAINLYDEGLHMEWNSEWEGKRWRVRREREGRTKKWNSKWGKDGWRKRGRKEGGRVREREGESYGSREWK